LDRLRNEKITILEIGIAYGGALQAFRDYFPYAKIVGYDVELSQHRITDMTRIELFKGNQSDHDKLAEVAKVHGPFDVIIDDACHQFEAQLVTLNNMWPHVKPGGFYFIEDVFALRGKRGNASSQIFHHIKNEHLKESAFAARHYVTDKTMIAFHPTMIVLEKA